MADFTDHLEKLLGAWKALLPFSVALITGTMLFAKLLYDREISTLKAERDAARVELASKEKEWSVFNGAKKPISVGTVASAGNERLEVITGRSYVNERVVLDGKHFERNNFSNVTLVYNGGRFAFMRNNVAGFQVASDNLQINDSWKFLFDIGFLKFDGRNEFGPISPSNPISVPAVDAK